MGGRTLVTGSAGVLGSHVVAELARSSVDVVSFDLVGGQDVLDLRQLHRAAAGCTTIVHLAAVPTDVAGREAETGATNVLGVWNVALVAEANRARRVVFASSVNAIGVFMGQGDPDGFPIADGHRALPVTPYSVAKLAAEEILAALSRRTGVSTVCIRLPALLDPGRYRSVFGRWVRGVESEITPYWEFGAYLDVRDGARAIVAACVAENLDLHERLMLTDVEPAHVAPMPELIEVALRPGLRSEARATFDDIGVLVDSREGWARLATSPNHHWSVETAGWGR
jgi:nucleoside-diphosphate-sugar epimerase